MKMTYTFPVIRNICDVLPAIEGRDEFMVANKGDYTVINYNMMMSDTFPAINTVVFDVETYSSDPDVVGVYKIRNDSHAALRRECRGIIFDSRTGDIIRRPHHKFFNVQEREETLIENIDLSVTHVIMDKLDGSMISPFRVGETIIFGTKMGETEVSGPAQDFAYANGRYVEFSRKLISQGMTPIFEWCTRKQRIVLDYPEDQLILTAVREMRSGQYVSYDTLVEWGVTYDIPVVRVFEPQTDMGAFVEYTRGLTDTEGFVIDFKGHKVKIKCDWYVALHKAKEAILKDYNIVELILDERLDDVKAHLPKEDRDRLTDFEDSFNRAVLIKSAEIMQLMYKIRDAGMDRKTFALGLAQNIDAYIRPIVFKNFDMEPSASKIDSDVRNTIRNNLTKTAKYEAIRDAWLPGVRFND